MQVILVVIIKIDVILGYIVKTALHKLLIILCSFLLVLIENYYPLLFVLTLRKFLLFMRSMRTYFRLSDLVCLFFRFFFPYFISHSY